MVNQHGDPQTRVADTASDDRHSPTAEVRTESDDRQNRDRKAKAADRRSVCPECDGRLITSDSGTETACASCGLVVAESTVDTNERWHTVGRRDDESTDRVGPPSTHLIHDRGLSTSIGWDDSDANGNALSAKKRQQLKRLRRWDDRFRVRDSSDRNLMHALGEIDRMASALGVPDQTRETASVIYRRALDEGLLPGRAIESVATAALYAANRIAGAPRSLGEVTVVSRVEQLRTERAYRQLSRELDLAIPPTNPAAFLGRIASAVDCEAETERRARALIDATVDEGVHSGKHPVGIAASALYAASRLCDDSIRQEDIAAAADISEVTIRNRYPEILAVVDVADQTV